MPVPDLDALKPNTPMEAPRLDRVMFPGNPFPVMFLPNKLDFVGCQSEDGAKWMVLQTATPAGTWHTWIDPDMGLGKFLLEWETGLTIMKHG